MKIDKFELKSLLERGVKRSEIAQRFNCSEAAISKAVRKINAKTAEEHLTQLLDYTHFKSENIELPNVTRKILAKEFYVLDRVFDELMAEEHGIKRDNMIMKVARAQMKNINKIIKLHHARETAQKANDIISQVFEILDGLPYPLRAEFHDILGSIRQARLELENASIQKKLPSIKKW